MKHDQTKQPEPCVAEACEEMPQAAVLSPRSDLDVFKERRSHMTYVIQRVEQLDEQAHRTKELCSNVHKMLWDLKNAGLPYLEAGQAECYLKNSGLWLNEILVRIAKDRNEVIEVQK